MCRRVRRTEGYSPGLTPRRRFARGGLWPVRSLRVMLERNAADAGARGAVLESIRRSGVPSIASDDLAAAVREATAILELGPGAGAVPSLLVNLGGARLALGGCLQPEDLPHGIITHPLPCRGGVPGLITAALERGVPVLNGFVIREPMPERPVGR